MKNSSKKPNPQPMHEEDYEQDYDDRNDDRDYDNGYSYSEQVWADRMDYANESDCPIQRAERRMGA